MGYSVGARVWVCVAAGAFCGLGYSVEAGITLGAAAGTFSFFLLLYWYIMIYDIGVGLVEGFVHRSLRLSVPFRRPLLLLSSRAF